MAELGQATSRRSRAGDSYANQWNRFVTWSEAAGRRSSARFARRRGGLPGRQVGVGCQALDPAGGGLRR